MNAELLKKNILFGTLYTAFLAPFIFFMLGLPMILQMKGFEASLIGMFQLVGLPSVIKFLISPVIDRFVFQKNHYKKWIITIGIVYVILLFAISFLSLENNFYLILAAILFTTLVSTFIDIPLNALSIKVFSKEERLSAASYKSSSYFLAGILGAGVFLLFYNHIGWRNTFIIMSGMVLIALFIVIFINEKDEKIEEKKVSFKTIISFFKQKDIFIWLFILSFYFAFISAVWIFMKPYLIHKGIKADEVAIYVGIYGSIAGFIGGIITSRITKKFSKRTILITVAIFNIISILMLILIENYKLNILLLLTVVTLTALSIAFSSSIIFSLMMDYSRNNSRGVDYSVQSSLFSLTRIISAVIAGILISSIGFEGMFLFEFLGMILVLFIIYRFYK
ncbi:MAG: MFS transporter [Campylobacteraceae bacterium]|nr:MFS transporter [Campylobacteraceae bacterium]